jgi:uncharacterized protein YndB with AHSA1/START domain
MEPVQAPAPQAIFVRREVEVEASPEEVWESLATEQGRERWLETDPQREILVETAKEPERLVWRWRRGEAAEPTRVEFQIVPSGAGARVIVTETAPRFPIALFAAAWAPLAAAA